MFLKKVLLETATPILRSNITKYRSKSSKYVSFWLNSWIVKKCSNVLKLRLDLSYHPPGRILVNIVPAVAVKQDG